jgi:hypothetical protein
MTLEEAAEYLKMNQLWLFDTAELEGWLKTRNSVLTNEDKE